MQGFTGAPEVGIAHDLCQVDADGCALGARPRVGEGARVTCRNCGSATMAGIHFCGTCGHAVIAADAGQRRHVTVMFCDLVGSTPLAERLDPEDLRDVIVAYQDVCADATERFGGFTAKYMGDGLLVYFGYPTAHEAHCPRGRPASFDPRRTGDRGRSCKTQP